MRMPPAVFNLSSLTLLTARGAPTVAAELEQHVAERTAAPAEANQLLSDEKARLRVVHAITLELAQSLELESTLTKALGLVSKIDSERIKRNFSFEPLRIADVLQESISMRRGDIARKSLAVQAAVDAHLPPIVTDKWHLEQVVRRLLSNAIKYTYPSGRIVLRAFLVTGGQVQVDVEDTGVGISPEQQQQLFRRFYRADNPLRGATDGAGLGLSIARSFVELLGGDLWVRSQADRGSTFSFTLPLRGDGQ
jgi:signal transduction histidine kinase